ncbi:MAG: GntR family transcriptional regulator [Chthoniobacterales bacterium]|nr:GntR family transcriptional regulator [Chthoniobacterales bacterium]
MTTLKTELRGIASVIRVDRRAKKPLHRQIYDSFRHRIIRRELRAGELVPSSRALARELRVSRLPVLNAYAQLLAEGISKAASARARSSPVRCRRSRARSPLPWRLRDRVQFHPAPMRCRRTSGHRGREPWGRSKSASRTSIPSRWTSGQSSSGATRAGCR